MTAAELLSVAAFIEDKYAQAFPSFGSERMGAPVVAFCRVDVADIRRREPVLEPDAVVVQDATLLHAVDVFQGLGAAGFVLLNTRKAVGDMGCGDVFARLPRGHVVAVAATDLAMAHLGRPLPNVPLLGAVAALTGVVSLEALCEAIRRRFPGAVGTSNVAAADAAYRTVKEAAC